MHHFSGDGFQRSFGDHSVPNQGAECHVHLLQLIMWNTGCLLLCVPPDSVDFALLSAFLAFIQRLADSELYEECIEGLFHEHQILFGVCGHGEVVNVD